MANKNFVKEVRIKIEFSELSRKAFTTMNTFLKTSINGESNLSKGLKGLTLRAPKFLVFRGRFLHNLHERP